MVATLSKDDPLVEYKILRFADGLVVDWFRCPDRIAARNHWEHDPTAPLDPDRVDNARCLHRRPKPKT